MKRKPFENAPVALQFLITLFAVLICVVISYVISQVISAQIFHINILSLLSSGNTDFTENEVNLLKTLQIIQGTFIFIIPPFVVAWAVSSSASDYLKFNSLKDSNIYILTIFLMLSAIPFINFLAQINQHMSLPESLSGIEQWMKRHEEEATRLTELFLKDNSTKSFFINVLMIGIIPAIGEELLFRGVIQRQITQLFRNNHVGIWFAAIIFSTLHLQFYGFLPRTLLGVLFGYLLVWSKSIWLPIIGHFTNNITAVIVSYFIANEKIDENIETIGETNNGIQYLIIGTVVFCGLLYSIYVLAKRTGTENKQET